MHTMRCRFNSARRSTAKQNRLGAETIVTLLQMHRSWNALPDRIRLQCESSNLLKWVWKKKKKAPHTHCKCQTETGKIQHPMLGTSIQHLMLVPVCKTPYAGDQQCQIFSRDISTCSNSCKETTMLHNKLCPDTFRYAATHEIELV